MQASIQNSIAIGVVALSQSTFAARELAPPPGSPVPLEEQVQRSTGTAESIKENFRPLLSDRAFREDLKDFAARGTDGKFRVGDGRASEIKNAIRDALGAPADVTLVLTADKNGAVSPELIKGVLTSTAYPEQRFAFEYRSADGSLRIEQVVGVEYGEIAQAIGSVARERSAVREAFSKKMTGQLGEDFEGILEMAESGGYKLRPERQNAACVAFQNIIGVPENFDILFTTDANGRIDRTRPIVGEIFKSTRTGSLSAGVFSFDPASGVITLEGKPVSRAGFAVAIEQNLAEQRQIFSVDEILVREQEKGHSVLVNGKVGDKQIVITEGRSLSIKMSDALHLFYGPPGELKPVRVTFADRARDGGTTRLTGRLPDGTELDIQIGIRFKGVVNGVAID